MGIANPVCFRWDAEGRLWVLCRGLIQLKPGEPADDKLFILEDKDQDGKADKVSVFADGLNMPTGFALGHGGVYLAEGPDLMHLRDTDGDGKADQSEVLFTGFGTGDTHQNINSLTWSRGANCSSVRVFIASPACRHRGASPASTNTVLGDCVRCVANCTPTAVPRVVATHGDMPFKDWGEAFIKSNGTGVSELLPSLVHTDHIGGGFWEEP